MAKKSYTKKELEVEVERVYQAHVVVLESIDYNVKAVAEGYQTIEERMERGFNDMRREMQGIDKRLIRIEAVVNELQDNMQEVKQEIQLIRKHLTGKIDTEEYLKLERRVERLEETVGIK